MVAFRSSSSSSSVTTLIYLTANFVRTPTASPPFVLTSARTASLRPPSPAISSPHARHMYINMKVSDRTSRGHPPSHDLHIFPPRAHTRRGGDHRSTAYTQHQQLSTPRASYQKKDTPEFCPHHPMIRWQGERAFDARDGHERRARQQQGS